MRNALDRLRRRNSELRAANVKLTAALAESEARRGDFESNLSHELMTPITAIKGYSESLAGGALKIPGRGLQFALIIEQHAERLALVVEDILHLTSLGAGSKKKLTRAVELRSRVGREFAAVKSLAARRAIELIVDVPHRMKVRFDTKDLSRVLRHLLENAVKYNRPNGTVEVTAKTSGRSVVVAIRDTGIGIPAGDLARIFDRFHRAENARAYTERAPGLGLALVRSMLLAGGCRIWAESAEGKGTTIFFTLPLAR